jgi:small subunit ribosomal protein S17
VRLNEVRMRERGVRKKMSGVVVRSSMDKTAVVVVDRLKKHSSYAKYIRRYSKYLVHDPLNKCQIGDKVRIVECRPISKNKRWQLLEVIEKTELTKIDANIEQPLEQ